MTRKRPDPPNSDHDFGDIEPPPPIVMSPRLWPFGRGHTAPEVQADPVVRLAYLATESPNATTADLQYALDLIDARAAHRRPGQRPGAETLAALRYELVLSAYAHWGALGPGGRLGTVLDAIGFDQPSDVHLWSRWQQQVPREWRDRSKATGMVVYDRRRICARSLFACRELLVELRTANARTPPRKHCI